MSIIIDLRYGEKQKFVKFVKVSWDKKGGNDLSNINRSELDGKTIILAKIHVRPIALSLPSHCRSPHHR